MTDLLEDLGEDEDALVVEEMEEGEIMLDWLRILFYTYS